MKSGKRQITKGIGLLNEDKIRTLRKRETFKYLGMLEADITKQAKVKEKN